MLSRDNQDTERARQLHHAIVTANVQEVERLLTAHPRLCQCQFEQHQTPLHLAARGYTRHPHYLQQPEQCKALSPQYESIIKLLIDKGASYVQSLTSNHQPNQSPLHLALRYFGSTQAVSLLVEGGASVSELEHNQSTVLHTVAAATCHKNHLALFKWLLTHGASKLLISRNSQQQTAHSLAQHNPHIENSDEVLEYLNSQISQFYKDELQKAIAHLDLVASSAEAEHLNRKFTEISETLGKTKPTAKQCQALWQHLSAHLSEPSANGANIKATTGLLSNLAVASQHVVLTNPEAKVQVYIAFAWYRLNEGKCDDALLLLSYALLVNKNSAQQNVIESAITQIENKQLQATALSYCEQILTDNPQRWQDFMCNWPKRSAHITELGLMHSFIALLKQPSFITFLESALSKAKQQPRHFDVLVEQLRSLAEDLISHAEPSLAVTIATEILDSTRHSLVESFESQPIDNLLAKAKRAETTGQQPASLAPTRGRWQSYRQALANLRDEAKGRLTPDSAKHCQQQLTKGYKELIKRMLGECLLLLPSPPCAFALMGLGSMSRDEVCPYSDLEYGVLTHEKTPEIQVYFKALITLFNFKALSLGETQPSDVPVYMPSGLHIDTGTNAIIAMESFLQTPAGMVVALLTRNRMNEVQAEKDKDIAWSLLTPCHLYGDKGLTEQFMQHLAQVGYCATDSEDIALVGWAVKSSEASSNTSPKLTELNYVLLSPAHTQTELKHGPLVNVLQFAMRALINCYQGPVSNVEELLGPSGQFMCQLEQSLSQRELLGELLCKEGQTIKPKPVTLTLYQLYGKSVLTKQLQESLARRKDAPQAIVFSTHVNSKMAIPKHMLPGFALSQLNADHRKNPAFYQEGWTMNDNAIDIKHQFSGPLIHFLTALSLIYDFKVATPLGVLQNLKQNGYFSANFADAIAKALQWLQSLRVANHYRHAAQVEQLQIDNLNAYQREQLSTIRQQLLVPIHQLLEQVFSLREDARLLYFKTLKQLDSKNIGDIVSAAPTQPAASITPQPTQTASLVTTSAQVQIQPSENSQSVRAPELLAKTEQLIAFAKDKATQKTQFLLMFSQQLRDILPLIGVVTSQAQVKHSAVIESLNALEGLLQQGHNFVQKVASQNRLIHALGWSRHTEHYQAMVVQIDEIKKTLSQALGVGVRQSVSPTEQQCALEHDRQALRDNIPQVLKEQVNSKSPLSRSQSEAELDASDRAEILALKAYALPRQLAEGLGLDEVQTQAVVHQGVTYLSQQHPNMHFTEPVSSYSLAKDIRLNYHELQFIRLLTRGSLAVIHLGRWQAIPVAIKRLISNISPREIKQFVNEVHVITQLRYPYITSFYGACLEPQPALVLEYMHNGSLEDYMQKKNKQRKTILFEIKLVWAIEIAKGLSFLHYKGILHRDLKTANVLLNEHKVAKLTDFNLSKMTDVQGTLGQVSIDKRWMAPEAIACPPRFTTSSDVYAFGMVLWSMLSQKKPFDTQKPSEILSIITLGRHEAITHGTPDMLKRIINRCWHIEHSQRPEASSLIEALEQVPSVSTHLDAQELCDSGVALERKGKHKAIYYRYAFELYLNSARKGVSLGFVKGATKAGTCLHQGRGCKKDVAAAEKWWLKAANTDKGHSTAQWNLYQLYKVGAEGILQDDAKAREYLDKAAGNGHIKAAEILTKRKSLL